MPKNVGDDHLPVRSTRDLILEAALIEFGEKGFDGTTTKGIAQRAKVNEVTLFRTFKSKKDLLKAVITHYIPEGLIKNGLQFDPALPIKETLEKNALMVLSYLQANRHLFMVIMREVPKQEIGPNISNNISELVEGDLGDYLSSQMAAGCLRKMDKTVAARAFFGMVQSYFMFNYVFDKREVDKATDRRFIKGFVDIFLDGLGGDKHR